MLPGRPMLDFEKLKKKNHGRRQSHFWETEKEITYSPSFVISSYYYYTLY